MRCWLHGAIGNDNPTLMALNLDRNRNSSQLLFRKFRLLSSAGVPSPYPALFDLIWGDISLGRSLPAKVYSFGH